MGHCGGDIELPRILLTLDVALLQKVRVRPQKLLFPFLYIFRGGLGGVVCDWDIELPRILLTLDASSAPERTRENLGKPLAQKPGDKPTFFSQKGIA